MSDLSGVGLPPQKMRLLGLLVILGVLQLGATFSCPKVLNQDLIADPSDCRKYYHCLTDGRYFIKSCPNGLVFEPKNKVCMWDSSRSCAPGDNVISPASMVAATSTLKAASPTDKKAATTTSQKPTTTEIKETSAPSKATSTTKTDEQTISEVKATKEAAPETKATKTETETVKDDTKTTVKSVETETTTADFSTGNSSQNVTGTSNTTDMRAGENPTSGEVESNDTNTSAVDTESTESFKTLAKKTVPKHSVLKRSPFVDNNRIDDGSPKITCTSAFAYVTDPENCHTFYHCNNWRPFQKRCPPGLFFDSQNLVCNWPHNVNCIEGYRAKTTYNFNNLRRVVRPQPNIQKVKVIESTTEKIPFLETIENDVRKIRYEEDSDSTTVQVTVKPWNRFHHKTSFNVPETSSVAELTTEQTTTTESTTTEATTTPTTPSPSTSTDSYVYETRPFESRSTWKDWNFDLFYTNSDRQDSDLDKLELFSNGKKVKTENKDQFMSTDDMYETKSSTPSAATESSTSEKISTSGKEIVSSDETTTSAAETSTDSVSTTTETASSEPSESTTVSSDAETTTITDSSSSAVPQSTDVDNMVSASNTETKTSEAYDSETTSVPEVSSRASSLDFGSDLDRELNHPRKIQHDGPAPSNPFMTSDRIAANQQSMYARDYHQVENVEIEKFMMKMLNDAMQSKHMVAREASDEYPDNLIDGASEKKSKAKEAEMGGSDTLDKWAIADKEGKKMKGTLIEENVEIDEIESSGEIENLSPDTEKQITNLILKDEAKPKEEKKVDNSTESPKAENETVVDVETVEVKEDNSTTSDTKTTTTAAVNATTTTTTTTTTTATTTKSAETTKVETNTTAKPTEKETTSKATAGTTTSGNDTATTTTTKPEGTTVLRNEIVTVKAVPLLKDVSDLCPDKNNCSAKPENKTEKVDTVEVVTDAKEEANTTTTTTAATTTTTTKATTSKASTTTTESKSETKVTTAKSENATTVKTEETTTTAKATVGNATEVTEAAKAENATEKTEVVKTTAAAVANVTKGETTTPIPIAKDAAGKIGNEFIATVDNEIISDDKAALEKDDKHLPLSDKAIKPEVAEVNDESNINATKSENNTITEDKSEVEVVKATTIEKTVNTTTVSNATAAEQTTSSEEDADEDVKSDVPTTVSMAVDLSSQSGKVLTGGSKATTKKSFISLSDLIKWYLRHWRHYSRWRDSKEVKPTPQ